MSLFANKTLLITGGTGYFGNAALNCFLANYIGEVRIFSRDEKRNTLTEFNNNNACQSNLEETKAKIASLAYIQDELKK